MSFRFVTLSRNHHRCLLREFHSSRTIQFPRGVRPRFIENDHFSEEPPGPEPLVEKKLEDDVEGRSLDKWQEYVGTKPKSSLETNNLDKQSFTAFGSIRMDKSNVANVHGQHDLYLEELEKESKLVEFDEEDTLGEFKNQNINFTNVTEMYHHIRIVYCNKIGIIILMKYGLKEKTGFGAIKEFNRLCAEERVKAKT